MFTDTQLPRSVLTPRLNHFVHDFDVRVDTVKHIELVSTREERACTHIK